MSADAGPYRHEALFYRGNAEFVEAARTFLREGIRRDEPMLVVVDEPKIAALRSALGPDAPKVTFADMHEVGRNPARIIPAWQEFLSASGSRPVRGIGEPVWKGRSADELDECHRHEALLNLAFADVRGFRLLCPYDLATLPAPDVQGAFHTHPTVVDAHGVPRASENFDPAEASLPFSAPLPEPDEPTGTLAFHPGALDAVRLFVSDHASAGGLSPSQNEELVLAVNELAANSLEHGGGAGVVRAWHTPRAVVCEVRDSGVISAPLAGRVRPAGDGERGFGLWLVNQLCDLVQIRAHASGSVVRVHMYI